MNKLKPKNLTPHTYKVKYKVIRLNLDKIVKYHKAGLSLREIQKVVGASHMTIKRLLDSPDGRRLIKS
jgi:transposase